jgi:hypothetical protein
MTCYIADLYDEFEARVQANLASILSDEKLVLRKAHSASFAAPPLQTPARIFVTQILIFTRQVTQ